jgi:UPF0042 nucleotide-binding protein
MEDQGWFAMDNAPPGSLCGLMEILSGNGAAAGSGVAVVTDIRGEGLLDELLGAVESLEKIVPDVRIVFLDASDDRLVTRYETTRRCHPLGRGVSTLEGIARERERLRHIRARADILIDTSFMSVDDLRRSILSELGVDEEPVTIVVSSFGFKNGIPIDCDYMFDVRFLPNPNYVQELRPLSGMDAKIQGYLESVPEKRPFMEMIESLLDFVLLRNKSSGKRQLHAAVGCTGGRHRSVAVAEELARRLSGRGYRVVTNHRDIDREAAGC